MSIRLTTRIQEKLDRKNELEKGDKEREKIIDFLKNQVSEKTALQETGWMSPTPGLQQSQESVLLPVRGQSLCSDDSVPPGPRPSGNKEKVHSPQNPEMQQFFLSRIQSSNPTGASQILARLKASVCNKEEKRICCPVKSSEGEKKTSPQKTTPGSINLHPVTSAAISSVKHR